MKVLAIPMHRPKATPATICRPGSAGTSAGRPAGRSPLAHQQQTNCHEQDGNCAFEPVIGDTRRQPRGEPMLP